MSRKVRFIHAADLHLGAPIRGLGALSEEWATRLQTAIPEAYERVIEAALSRDVDFVVLAGDMFDASFSSYCDYLLFFEGLEKLHQAGIPTYLVTGNHDPYTSWVRNIARLPASAHLMGVGVPTFELYERDGEALCLIGGRSYYGQAWPADEGIAAGITRQNAIGALSPAHPDAAGAPFAIGIIHTGFEVDASKAAVDEQALLAQDIDYWACGHLHRHLVRPTFDDPRIVFPGCVQGRDIKEMGERGCYLVELEEGVSPRLEFVPTASVAFHSLDVDVSACLTLPDVERLVKTELFRESGHDFCSEMVAHVNLVGRTDLHAYLRQRDVIVGMRRRVNDACPGFFCDAIVDCTRYATDDALPFQWDDSDAELIEYVQSTLVQRGIAVPDALARRMGDFRTAAETLAFDLVSDAGDGMDLPAARRETERRLAGYTSRDDASEHSLHLLGDELEAKYIEVRRATELTASHRQYDRELHELESGKNEAGERLAALTDEVDDLTSCRDELKSIDASLAGRRDELERLQDTADELTVLVAGEPFIDPRLLGMTLQDDRLLRDKLEGFADERQRVSRAVEEAKERSAASSAAYEALGEIDADEARSARRHTRTAQMAVSVLLPVIFVLAGIAMFVRGRQITSLSFTVFGIGLVVLAFFLAAAALVVLFRPNKDTEMLDNRRKDAQWVMLQDKKLLDARIAEKDELDAELNAMLEHSGLQGADGSIRQALLMLDDAQEARARMAEHRQSAMAHEMRKSAASKAIEQLESQRSDLLEKEGLPPDATVRSVESTLRAKTAELESLEEELEKTTARLAQLSRQLEAVKTDRTFDSLKLDYQQMRARLRAAKHDYIVLLLANRLLAE